MPGMPGIAPGPAPTAPAPGPTALVHPPPANVAPAGFATCAAAVQPCGTDNRPTNAAWLGPAEMAPLRYVPAAPAAPGVSRGVHVGLPEPAPIGGSAVGGGAAATETALMSAIPPVTAGSMMAGLT